MLNDNESIKKWLALILFERFGHNFIIKSTDNNYEISLKDSSSKIIFDEIIPEFYEFGSGLNLPCSKWNGKEEGFKLPIQENIPAPGKNNIQSPLIEFKVGNAYIHYDILGFIYWMLNRIEEIGRQDLDEHERFPATSSHAYKHGYLERPIVDEWLDIMGQTFKKVFPSIKLKKNTFSLQVSHDVDQPSIYAFKPISRLPLSIAGELINKNFKKAALIPLVKLDKRDILSKKDPYNTFKWLMNISKKNNIQSIFYFISGITDIKRDCDYTLQNPKIINLLKEIDLNGHEIGIHPSYNTFLDSWEINKEATNLKQVLRTNRINQYVTKSRMHFLRWRHPHTLKNLEKAGIKYDSTLTYADHAGFRCGTCFDYPGYDTINNIILKIRIAPLIAMDYTITSSKYMGLNDEYSAYSTLQNLKNRCREVKGSFTLLWHNSEFDSDIKKNIYKRIVTEK